MSNGFIYIVDAHFIDKIEEKKILDPSACGFSGGRSWSTRREPPTMGRYEPV
jgi:hypothetical protein